MESEFATTALTTFCPVFHRAVELIGRRWTGAIVRALLSGIAHFSELTAAIPDLSDPMLSERLKELEAEGIVARTVIPSTPVRVEYRLTEKGRTLEPVLNAIGQWAGTWLVTPADAGADTPPRPVLAFRTARRGVIPERDG